ncbi:hypothetical protein C8R43DRAFT_641319 [Mycena crocata]|nr:hypothetical protein C8R43DRAFT_641319 [Mycena crocata]
MIFSDTIRWKSAPWKSAAFKLTWIQAPPTVDIPGLPPSVVADYWRSCISVNANVAIKHRGTKIYENIVNHLCSTGWDPITCTISSRYISHLWAAFQLLDYLFARMERANGGQQPTIAATPCDTSSTEPLYSMLVDWPDTLREHGEGRARIPPDIPDPVKHFLTCCRAASLRDSAAVNLEHASWLLGWFFKNGVVVPEKSKIPKFLNSVASSRNLVIPDASMPELARVNSTAMSTSLIFALAASFTLLMGGQQLSALTTGTLDRIKASLTPQFCSVKSFISHFFLQLWNSFGRKGAKPVIPPSSRDLRAPDSPILWSVEDIIFNGLCEMVFEGKLASPTLKSLREDPNFKAVITLPADSHERDCFALPPLPSRPSSVSPAPFSFPGALSFTRNQVTGYGVDVDNSPLSKPLPNLREPSFDFSGPTFSASPPFKRYYSSLSNSPVLEYPPGSELGPLSTLSSDSPPQSELAQKRKRAGDDGQDNDITGEEDELEDEKLPTKQARHRRRQKREGGEETDGEGAETDNEGIDSVNGDDEPKEFQLAAVQMVLYRALLDGPSTRTHYVDSVSGLSMLALPLNASSTPRTKIHYFNWSITPRRVFHLIPHIFSPAMGSLLRNTANFIRRPFRNVTSPLIASSPQRSH